MTKILKKERTQYLFVVMLYTLLWLIIAIIGRDSMRLWEGIVLVLGNAFVASIPLLVISNSSETMDKEK